MYSVCLSVACSLGNLPRCGPVAHAAWTGIRSNGSFGSINSMFALKLIC
jgi:hypothetical protein